MFSLFTPAQIRSSEATKFRNQSTVLNLLGSNKHIPLISITVTNTMSRNTVDCHRSQNCMLIQGQIALNIKGMQLSSNDAKIIVNSEIKMTVLQEFKLIPVLPGKRL